MDYMLSRYLIKLVLMKKVSILIISYKDGAFLDDCIDTVRMQSYENKEIIIKNQKSDTSQETYDRISKKYPEIKVINGENNGLSKGSNECAKAASGDYLLFMGGDARFRTSDTLSGLVEYMDENKDVGAATAKLLLADGTEDMDAHRAFPTPWISFSRLFGLQKLFPKSALFNGYFLPDRDMTKPHEVDLCISHFMIVRRSVFEEINGFDENFFLYGEDVDFCYRIKEAKHKIMYLPQFEVTHLKGVGVGVRKTTRHLVKRPKEYRMRMQQLTTDSMILFVKKHYFKKYPAPFVYLMIFAAWGLGKFRVITESLKRD